MNIISSTSQPIFWVQIFNFVFIIFSDISGTNWLLPLVKRSQLVSHQFVCDLIFKRKICFLGYFKSRTTLTGKFLFIGDYVQFFFDISEYSGTTFYLWFYYLGFCFSSIICSRCFTFPFINAR